jgi:putative ABC transport system ATP-binding protein
MFTLIDVQYKDILDIKSLNIKKNKVTCIVGESGSGKTTLLKLLNKLISCDRGEIFYNGENIREINSVQLRREVVMLSQAPAIFKGSIKDNLLIGLQFAEKPLVTDERLNNVLKLVRLDKDLLEDADKLSGGEKQRLAIGRVLLLEPEVLLLDEPSSALDEDTEHILVEALVKFAKENQKTLIMVTHSKKVANQYSDDMIEIKKGISLNKEIV